MKDTLQKGSLKNIEFQEITNFLKENNQIEGIKEFVRNYLFGVLQGNNGQIKKEDFEVMKDYVKRLKEYQNILKSKIVSKEFSLGFVEKIIFSQSLEDFSKILNNKNVIMILISGEKDIIEYIVKLFDIKTKEEFESFCSNNNIQYVLMWAKKRNLEYIVKLYDIKTKEEFENLCDNKNIRDILKYVEEKKLEYIVKLFDIKTKEEFESFCSNNNIQYVLMWAKKRNLEYIVKLYDIKTKEEFESFCDNKNIRDILKYVEEKKLEYIVKLFDIKTKEEFENIFNNENVRFVLILAKERNLEYIVKLYNIKTKEEFENLCDNKNIRDILKYVEEKKLEYIVKLFDIKTKEEFENLCDNKNVANTLKYMNEKNVLTIFSIYETEEQRTKLVNFLTKKIFKSEQNTEILFNNLYNLSFRNFKKIFLLYIENKQKSLIDFIKILLEIRLFNININLDKIKTIEDFKDEKGKLKKDELIKFFEKVLKINNNIKSEKKINELKSYIKFNNIVGLEKILAEEFIKYFTQIYHRKLKTKIISNLKDILSDSFDSKQIENKRLQREEFIESYKISINQYYNKKQINELLLNYLQGKFDNIQEGEIKGTQYDTKKNKQWLNKYLTIEQQKIWLSKNRKEINIKKNSYKDETGKDINIKINNYFDISIKKLEEINNLGFKFQTRFNDEGNLINYFNKTIKAKEKEIKEKNNNLYEDLKLQIENIKELFKERKVKKVDKIIIEKELDPLKMLMMGNWVDGSCLSFYSKVYNSWSAISNTIDVNKGVFYIKDENGNILGRCLITIGNDKKISRYKMYYNGNVSSNIDNYFDEYMKELAGKIGLKLNGDSIELQLIEAESWYDDGIQEVYT